MLVFIRAHKTARREHSPVGDVLPGGNLSNVGHRQDALLDGLAGGVCCCHGDGCRGLVHAQELT